METLSKHDRNVKDDILPTIAYFTQNKKTW